MSENQKSTLLVDGEVLKQHILSQGRRHTAQEVLRYLHHMVQEIKEKFPDTDVRVNYYGVRAAEEAIMPISGKKYPDIDIKQAMRFASLPNAELKSFWSRMYYPYQEPWIMKPESYTKTTLTDADFRLNEQPKGLLTQLVDEMAERAVAHRDSRLFVYGDADDMAYALETTNGLDMPVDQIVLDNTRPHIAEFTGKKEPFIVGKETLAEVSESLRQPWAQEETLNSCLNLLRGAMGDKEQEVFLMLDMGGIRQYLFRKGLRMSVQNVQILLKQIQESLPEKPTKTIFYHGVMIDWENKKTTKIKDECSIEFQLDKRLFSCLPNVEFSLGKTRQDKLSPVILKKSKWHEPNAARLKEDFVPNFRQYDVDDRIAYDMALARLNPMVKRIFLVSSDGDFVHSVENAKLAGLQVSLVQLEDGAKCLSARLERSAEEVIHIEPQLENFITRQTEERLVHEKNEEEKRARLQQVRREKRLQARLETEEDEEGYEFSRTKPSKEERWGRACVKHKKLARKIIAKNRKDYRK